MEKENKKRIVVFGIIMGTVTLISVLGTYAYFLSSIEETVNERLVVKAGTMQLVFRDTDEIVTNTEATMNFGDIITKEFEIENTGTLSAYAKISWDNIVNTYLEESLTYKLEYKLKGSEEDWKSIKTANKNVPRSEEASKIEIVDRMEIPSGVTYVYKITIKLEDLLDINQTQDLRAVLSTKFTLDEGNKPITSESVLENLGLKVKEKSPNFNQAATTDETIDGLYSMEDDYGTSYYFRGAVENNYVKFGKNSNGQNMYWRIIRINGDGSLRIQYDGTQAYENGTSDENRVAFKSAWNSNEKDAKYVGWMFGGSQGEASTSYEQATRNETNSDIKTEVDNWYKNNIENTGYSMYLSDNVFCNERAIDNDLTITLGEEGKNTTLGYGTNDTSFKKYYMRNNSVLEANLICTQKNDKFTVEDLKIGNGKLQYPVGLINFDELLIAGSGFSKDWYTPQNSSFYLYKGVWFWTMTPQYFGCWSSTGCTSFMVSYNAYYDIGNDHIKSINGVSPVINIDSQYVLKMQGNGTRTNPFEIIN